MKYIKSMELVNFQSHKATHIDFSESLNVISGPSDNGKSAIIRALKWILYNEPKGTDFIRQGESTCRVSITLNDNTTIVRERSKSKNMYKLINPDGIESIFEGFGNEIPKEILLAHGINRFYVDSTSSDSINLAEQLEGPFLISQPGSVKAKAIGKLVGVNIIDEALKQLNKDSSGLQYEEKRLSADIADMKEKLKEFEYLEKNKQYIDRKEILLNILKNKVSTFKKLEELNKTYMEIEQNIKDLKKIISILRSVDLALDLNLKAVEKNRFMDRLSTINNKLIYLKTEMDVEKNILDSTNQIDNALRSFVKLQDFVTRHERLFYNKEKFDNYTDNIDKSIKIIKALNDIGKTQDEHKNLTDLIVKLNKLEELNVKISSVNTSLLKGEKYLEKLSNNEHAEVLYSNLINNVDKYSKLINLHGSYKELFNESSITNKEISNQSISMQKITEEYIAILKEIGKCPVCLSPIENHTMEHIIKEFKGEKNYEQL